jgi:outer membrane protein assembly factor BamA
MVSMASLLLRAAQFRSTIFLHRKWAQAPSLKLRIFRLPLLLWVCWLAQPVAADPGIKPRDGADAPVIGSIRYKLLEIFDTTIPEENNALYRLANKLHIQTKESVIAKQLLFKSGDTYSQSKVDESERILRSRPYLHGASIRPVGSHDGVVDLEVTTQDVWSLNTGLSFGRKGGKNTSRIKLEEANFLGTGASIGVEGRSDSERDAKIFKYEDPGLFDGRWSLNVSSADNSDGYRNALDIERPFYSLDTRHAGGANFIDDDRIVSIYELGKTVEQFERQQRYVDAYYGWSSGLSQGRSRRWSLGMTYDDNRFAALPASEFPTSEPAGRKLVYPSIGFESVADAFSETVNFNQIGFIEDIYLGTHVQTKLGFASTGLGSDRDAWLFSGSIEHSFGASSRQTFFVGGDMSARREDGGIMNMVISPSLRFYRQRSPQWTSFIGLHADYGHRLDEDNQLLLGGENGLRGYPLHYLAGDRLALLTLEQRYFSDWYPLRLFRVGGAIFFDAGRVIGTPQGLNEQATPGVLKDVGFGLRLGNMRSSFGNVIHVDLAFPLDGDPTIDKMQFLIETKQEF